jgi:hypothetical protein
MASNPMFQVPHHREVDRFQWQQGHPDEPEERQIGVDPFSLRQLSRVDIDRPLPIPSVSVDDQHLPAYAPARSASACSSVPQSPRLSSPAAPPTRWDAHLALAPPATSSVAETNAASRSKSFADGETELANNDFDDILSSPERRASAPQRWGSDVPLISGARPRKGKHGTDAAPFSCCLYLPGLTRRNRAPPPPPMGTEAAARSSSGSAPATFRGPKAASFEPEPELDDPSTARQSTTSLAVSLERFSCRFSSRSSGGLALPLDDEDDDEAAPSSSYFDLPLELILGCENEDYGDGETGLPMHAAFMFDSDGTRKSVLKNGTRRGAASAKVSDDASGTDRIPARHHVRFSVTSGSALADP